jgi:hypothetical protein
MRETAFAAPKEQDFILSSLSPSSAQKRVALGVVLLLVVSFFIIAGPLSTVQVMRIDAFVPVYATAIFVNDSITAVLLFAQFSILRSRALLAISSGYLFTALISIPWILTFPGVFAPGGSAWCRAAEHSLALHRVALRLSHVRNRLCSAKQQRSHQAVVAGRRACGHPFEYRHHRGHRVCSGACCNSGP